MQYIYIYIYIQCDIETVFEQFFSIQNHHMLGAICRNAERYAENY